MSEPAKTLKSLSDRYWEFESHESPFNALLAGEKLKDAVLFREAPADYDRKDARAEELLLALDDIPVNELHAQDQATAKLMRRELTKVRDFYGVKAHLRPSLFPAGPDFNLRFFANSANANTVETAELYLDQLNTVADFIDDLKLGLNSGRDFGFRYPKFVLKRSGEAVRGGIDASAKESALIGPYTRSPISDSPKVRSLLESAITLIDKDILPALHSYADYIDQDLMRDGRDTIACTDELLGDQYYDLLVKNFTSLDMTADDAHELGLQEVDRVSEEIDGIADQAGFSNRADEYREFLTANDAFVTHDLDTHLNEVRSICKEIDLQVPAFFSEVPRITYGVRLIPAELSNTLPPAYAQPSPADNSAPGVFWLTSIPSKCPNWFYRSLALHEGWPGHLMQIALMQEQTALPKFRRNGALKYTACIEGWAMYCETLGTEMDIYKTPHDHYGRLLGEIWRSVRLVVDTGIHTRGWTRDQAIKYTGDRVAIPKDTLEAEIDRYIALPGQALAYQPGNLKFRELRTRAEKRLQDHFDIREFHNQLIASGPVTLPILDDLTEAWIVQQESAV